MEYSEYDERMGTDLGDTHSMYNEEGVYNDEEDALTYKQIMAKHLDEYKSFNTTRREHIDYEIFTKNTRRSARTKARTQLTNLFFKRAL